MLRVDLKGAAGAVLAIACGLGSTPASSQGTSAADMAAAEVLYKEGKRLMADGRIGEACPKLQESVRLDPGIGAMLYLADCYEKNAQTASAWAQFLEAAYAAKKANDEREAVALRRAAQLEPKLARLTIVVPASIATPNMVIKRDGTIVNRAAWGTGVPVDPGGHAIEVTAPQRKRATYTAEVAIQGQAEIVIRALEEEDAPPATSTAAPVIVVPLPPPVVPKAGDASRGRGQRIGGMVMTGLGAVGLGFGIGFGVLAGGNDKEASDHCDATGCDPTGVALGKSAKTAAAGSTAGFVAGGVLIAAGLAVFFTAPVSTATALRAQPIARGAMLTWDAPW